MEGVGPWTYSSDPTQLSYYYDDVSLPQRLPDFVTFQMDGYVFSMNATYTRYGDIFLGGGFDRQYNDPFNFGVSISDGWMINPCKNGHPTRQQLNNFLKGYSTGASAYLWGGGGFSTNKNGEAFNVGVGFGGFGYSPGMVNSYRGNVFGE